MGNDLNDDERHFFHSHNESTMIAEAMVHERAEMMALTCAALTGLFSTPMMGTPDEFAAKAVSLARATYRAFNKSFSTKE